MCNSCRADAEYEQLGKRMWHFVANSKGVAVGIRKQLHHFLLRPFYNNFSKRIVKSPKLYFYDTGLLSNLLKINDVSKIENQSIKGTLFENMIISQYVKRLHHKNEKQIEPWFWRDSEGNEVDMVLEKSQQTEIVEIKATQTIMPDLFKGLNYYAALAKETKLIKTLIYGGNERQNRTVAQIVPWNETDV